jgi:predicted nucleic acid-binding Zn ribbon protein
MLCPNCAAEISDAADACPKCGEPIAAKVRRRNLLAVLIVVLGIVAIVGAYWLSGAESRRLKAENDRLNEQYRHSLER